MTTESSTITPEEIEDILQQALPDCRSRVEGESGRYLVTVTGTRFAGLSRVRRQQTVYTAIRQQIADGSIHAVTIRALTPEEHE